MNHVISQVSHYLCLSEAFYHWNLQYNYNNYYDNYYEFD